MMKVNEFIQRVSKAACVQDDEDLIQLFTDSSQAIGNEWFMTIEPKKQDLNVAFNWTNVKFFMPEDMFYVLNLVNRFKETPVEQRFDEPKYRVRFTGLNSDKGPQYLTAKWASGNRIGKVFACAENHSLKQTFTREELKDLANRARDDDNAWLAIYILNKLHWKLVNSNE
ncbi:hypothetical protein [Bartonella sp. CL63NXGY]|uniref:hypothetical protein n=1 Tax=Bartonella sp. CL63NXGY TaxID=3243538 RepID=UPI0035D0302D